MKDSDRPVKAGYFPAALPECPFYALAAFLPAAYCRQPGRGSVIKSNFISTRRRARFYGGKGYVRFAMVPSVWPPGVALTAARQVAPFKGAQAQAQTQNLSTAWRIVPCRDAQISPSPARSKQPILPCRLGWTGILSHATDSSHPSRRISRPLHRYATLNAEAPIRHHRSFRYRAPSVPRVTSTATLFSPAPCRRGAIVLAQRARP